MSAPSVAISDWTQSFEGSFADEFCHTLDELPLRQLQRFPPPKSGGLPLGHEVRVARRFVTGDSAMLDPSGLSGFYRKLASKKLQSSYRGLVLGEPLAHGQWESLLSASVVNDWTSRDLLKPASGDRLRCSFRVIVLGKLRFVVDHNDSSIPQRVHIGQDSLNMAEFVSQHVGDTRGGMLDVGTGSGLQLLSQSRHRETALGVDINPRAVRLARLNARLSGMPQCQFEEWDAFNPDWRPRPFHLVTWNLPFMFFPEPEVSSNLDGHGGHLGIALTLAFVERLVELLDPAGVAWLMSSAPRMLNGQNGLEIELAKRAERLGLDISTFVLQKYWDKRHVAFHRAHHIRSFESVMIQIRLGTGKFERHPPNVFRRAVDQVRTVLQEWR